MPRVELSATPYIGVLVALVGTEYKGRMGKNAVSAIYVLVMVVVIVGVDILIFRHHLWPRLAANVGIVLVFGALYFRFVKRA